MTLICLALITLMTLTPLVSGARHVKIAQLAQSGNSIEERGTVSDVRTQLGLPDGVDIQETKSIVSAQGTTIRRYHETYKGIKIYDTIIGSEQQGDTGTDEVISGDVFFDLEEDLADALDCKISNDEAKALLLERFPGSVTHEKYEDIIYVDESGTAKYTTQVSLSGINTTNGHLMRPFGFVDKCDKVVLYAYDRRDSFTTESFSTDPAPTPATNAFCSTTAVAASLTIPLPTPTGSSDCDLKAKGGNPKRVVHYGTPGYCLTLMKRSSDGKWCYLENEYVKTVDLENTDDELKTEVVEFECSKGYPDAINGGFSPAFDGFFFGTRSAQMYKEWYNYDLFKDNPFFVKVHFNQSASEAYWWYGRMVLGDGAPDEYPFTTLDVIAHELGHGVTGQTSKLDYCNQSGGINEAFSDMVGVVAEEFVFGQTDFIVGNELNKVPGVALRYFDDPTKDGVSIKHVDNYHDNMDVHFSSGIYNHVFWQMANVKNMGVRAAFDCFLHANILFWSSTTDFEDGACGTLRAAYSRGYDLDPIKESFAVTGITTQNCNDLSQLVTSTLRSGETRIRLTVSILKNPLYKMAIPSGATTLNVTVTGGVKVAISRSYKRSVTPLASGQGSAKADVSSGNTVYIRVYKDDAIEVNNVSLTVATQ